MFMDPNIDIAYDRILVPGALNVPNWSLDARTVTVATVEPAGFVRLVTTGVPIPTLVSYAPPPFDCVGDPDLTPVIAFAAFPVV